MGHSLGAFVASAAATQLDVCGVINIDQRLRMSDFKTALAPLEAMLRGSDADFHAALELVFSVLTSKGLDAATSARFDDNARRARQNVVLGVWGLVFDTTAEDLDALIAATMPSITCPYLAIHGDDPGSDYAEWLRTLLPQATVEFEVGAGHMLHLVDPPGFSARVRAFAAATI